MAPMTSVSVASSELAEVETRDPFVIVGVVVVGRGMVPFADFQERTSGLCESVRTGIKSLSR